MCVCAPHGPRTLAKPPTIVINHRFDIKTLTLEVGAGANAEAPAARVKTQAAANFMVINVQ